MPLPLLPALGVALVGGVIGACITRMAADSDGYIYDEDGYNSLGFDKSGFNRDGYDREGYDREGFGRDGLDREGFARDGYNAEGRDRNGFDRDGRDAQGYDREGLDALGRNRKGFNRAGWNEHGRDITGHDAGYYVANAAEIRERLSKAEKLIDAGDYEHASLDIRKGAEQAVKCVIAHTLGIGRYKRHFESDIDACKGAFEDDLIGRLHTLRRTCSDQLHVDIRDVDNLQIDVKYVDNLQSRLLFCVETLKETLAVVEGYVGSAA